MIVKHSGRKVSYGPDHASAVFVSEQTVAIQVPRSPGGAKVPSVRLVVEVLQSGGGMMPRALLGGIFVPSESDRLLIQVQTSSSVKIGTQSSLSALWDPLIPGLPDEFVQEVINGITRSPLSAGDLVIDRAAFDPIESSSSSFGMASELLTVALEAKSAGQDLGRVLGEALEGWV